MKSGTLFLASIPLAIAATIWIAPLGAQTGSLGAFCPDSGSSPRCSAAVALYLGGKPSDSDIIATINAIADGTRARRLSAASCADLRAGFELMAGAVKDVGSATLIRTLADALCPGSGGTPPARQLHRWNPRHPARPAPADRVANQAGRAASRRSSDSRADRVAKRAAAPPATLPATTAAPAASPAAAPLAASGSSGGSTAKPAAAPPATPLATAAAPAASPAAAPPATPPATAAAPAAATAAPLAILGNSSGSAAKPAAAPPAIPPAAAAPAASQQRHHRRYLRQQQRIERPIERLQWPVEQRLSGGHKGRGR